MARLSARSVKSRQNRVLRYVVSTDIDKSAADLGVSTKQLNRFLRAKPETVQKHPEQYNRLLESNPQQVAKEKDVKLVQRLSGKRLGKAYDYRERPRVQKAVRLAQATREKRRVIEKGEIVYKPVKGQRAAIAREQILTNMAGLNSKSIIEMTQRGDVTEQEGRQLFRKLWKNSGVSQTIADQRFDEMMS